MKPIKSFKEQFDLLTEAYISGKVDPYNCHACFVGNMLKGDDWSFPVMGWAWDTEGMEAGMKLITSNGYTFEQIKDIEIVFLKTIAKHINTPKKNDYYSGIGVYNGKWLVAVDHPNYENALFTAFEETLEFLKAIHIEAGEVIDEVPTFVKRKLETV